LKRGVSLDADQVVIRGIRPAGRFPLRWDLPGPHNVENALASIAVAVAGKIPVRTIRRVIKRFRGVEHRLEYVRSLRGTNYINDSKATNVDSTRVALESFQEPLVLIMGARAKEPLYDFAVTGQKARPTTAFGRGRRTTDPEGAWPGHSLRTGGDLAEGRDPSSSDCPAGGHCPSFSRLRFV